MEEKKEMERLDVYSRRAAKSARLAPGERVRRENHRRRKTIKAKDSGSCGQTNTSIKNKE